MTEVISKPEKVEHKAAKRCPDYDSECVDVKNHATCWIGGTFYHDWGTNVLTPVDGYCPFVIGMES